MFLFGLLSLLSPQMEFVPSLKEVTLRGGFGPLVNHSPLTALSCAFAGTCQAPEHCQELLVFTGVGTFCQLACQFARVTCLFRCSPRLWEVITSPGTCPNPSTHSATHGPAASGHISVLTHPKIVFSYTRMTPDYTHPIMCQPC